jgi:hypothetical protein
MTECQLDVKPFKNEAVQLQKLEQHIGEGDPPIFLKPLSDLKFPVGSDVCLHCEIKSSSPYELKWYKDNNLIEETDNVTVSIKLSLAFFICYGMSF